MEAVDGNAIGGLLHEVFGTEMTRPRPASAAAARQSARSANSRCTCRRRARSSAAGRVTACSWSSSRLTKRQPCVDLLGLAASASVVRFRWSIPGRSRGDRGGAGPPVPGCQIMQRRPAGLHPVLDLTARGGLGGRLIPSRQRCSASAARTAALVAAALRSSEKTPPGYGTVHTCSICGVYVSSQVAASQPPRSWMPKPAMVSRPFTQVTRWECHRVRPPPIPPALPGAHDVHGAEQDRGVARHVNRVHQ